MAGHYLLLTEDEMGSSLDELVAQVMALSIRKHVGQSVDAEVKAIISKCQTEQDKQHILRLCRGLGLN